jgi:hypothetical protein
MWLKHLGKCVLPHRVVLKWIIVTPFSTSGAAVPAFSFSRREEAFNSGQNSKRIGGLQEYLGVTRSTFS